MGKCTSKILRVEFDVSDEQVTVVTVYSDFEGDCPVGMRRVSKKTFPARHSMIDLLTMDGGVTDYQVWD